MVAFGTLLVLSLACGGDESVTFKPMSTGAMSKLGGYRPQRITLATAKPATIKKEPDGLTAPLYGILPIKAPEGAVLHVIVDEPEGKPARLFVDSNGNGDLTDDGEADWKGKAQKDKAGVELTQYTGGATVKLGAKGKTFDAHLGMYRFDKNDAGRPALKDVLLYYNDYAATGEIKFGDKTYKAILNDELASGDFRGTQITGEGKTRKGSGVSLKIDVNGNGSFDARGESFDVRDAFNIGGTTWELRDMSVDGSSFKLVKSEKTVAEIPPPPDHSKGKKITAFEAKMMDGKSVKFPGDYKGKVVLIDFWATWCGPCMVEMPNVVANYEKYHDKGFEILGVTLDQKDAEAKIKQTTEKSKMPWPQVYDGGYWQAEIAQLYVINSIPAAYLVDGDTGEVLDDGKGLRGPALGKTIEAALEKKSNKAK
ncbi:MAG: TlpA disulfide reductase family protein [Planctomycetota bacterium]